MKLYPVVPETCHGQVHGARKERRITRTKRRIIIRNGAKTISLRTLFGRLNKTPNLSLDDAHVNQLQTTLQWLL